LSKKKQTVHDAASKVTPCSGLWAEPD